MRGVRVLVVEDHPDTRDTIATMLRREGAQVDAFPTAQEAFDAFQASPPDVLVCDLLLPDTNGLCLMRRIRGTARGHALPAVAITGQQRAEATDEARAAGFDAFLTKPILGDDLVRTVRRLVED
jgi:two-component system CheB/CheR fusion protein